ncbi:type II toxin-antitoxin system HicB family antitoxin [Snodgrassella communis]|uniref:type II toxin-antitoxin system HicB family antitoxin n=1 Tax=Snodgrassella communis TaxID=2946699 RepID=UPI000C1F6894|nr:type II toxin-antitoxin system HicB family antitoxin [Snodgrassella communis]
MDFVVLLTHSKFPKRIKLNRYCWITLSITRTNANVQRFSVEVNIDHLTLKPERFNVSWQKYILDKVDRYVLLTHDNRSNFLTKAALDKINHLS